MTDRELMQQALEALEAAEVTGNCSYGATELLRTRLAQPEQERNVWRWHDLSLHDIKSAIEAKLKEKNNGN